MDFLDNYGINIKNKELLLTALTHSSYANEHNCSSYERLEFLGDSVLQVIVSEYLYNNYDLKEGEMSKKRASFVCEDALFEYEKKIGYSSFIRVGHGQLNNVNETIVADVFEAILGAIYLDLGFDIAKKYIYEIVVPYIKDNYIFLTDYKSRLQEMTQMEKKTIEYVLVSEEGPSHDKKFTVEARIDGMIFGKGVGKSKKDAEQEAAKDAFKRQAK